MFAVVSSWAQKAKEQDDWQVCKRNALDGDTQNAGNTRRCHGHNDINQKRENNYKCWCKRNQRKSGNGSKTSNVGTGFPCLYKEVPGHVDNTCSKRHHAGTKHAVNVFLDRLVSVSWGTKVALVDMGSNDRQSSYLQEQRHQ